MLKGIKGIHKDKHKATSTIRRKGLQFAGSLI